MVLFLCSPDRLWVLHTAYEDNRQDWGEDATLEKEEVLWLSLGTPSSQSRTRKHHWLKTVFQTILG